MNLHHVGVIARYELRQSLLGTRGVLFLAIYGILWFWMLWRMADGWAANFAEQEGQLVAAWVLDDKVLARILFVEHPPTLGVFFLMFMNLIPLFTMWGAGDQTASDIGTRHLRFLIHRCGRSDIYLGRFLGALAFMVGIHALVALAGTGVSLYADYKGALSLWHLQLLLVVLVYTLPFVALMAMWGALMGSAAGAILTAIIVYAAFAMAATFLSLRWEDAHYLGYLFPAPFKGALLGGQGGAFAGALLALLLYTIVYFGAGWLVFQRRDI